MANPQQKDLRQPSDARLERHGRGSGPISPNMVEKRASELAEIEGRSRKGVTKADRDEALSELRDDTLEISTDEARSDIIASTNPADIAVDTGHEVKSLLTEDEQMMAERETEEGVREAEHERMLQASRRLKKAEEE